MFEKTVSIGSRKIGAGEPVFIIAEAGVNHNGRFDIAKRLIDAASGAGADAIKFQTFTPDELVLPDAPKAEYQKKRQRDAKENQQAMLSRLRLKRSFHAPLKRYAEKKRLLFLSTPFSLSDAKFLRALKIPALKIGSGEANNLPFLGELGKWGLPILLSTGMCTLREVGEAVRILRSRKLVLFHCTTNYPAPLREANLRAIGTLRKTFNVPVGFSDHTAGIEAAQAAAALGAVAIEKHITLDKKMSGPDHAASLDPKEFKSLVRAIRGLEQALGTGVKKPFPSEKKIAKVARKSIVTLRPIRKGEKLSRHNLGIKRPGTGIPPRRFYSILGKKARRVIPGDAILRSADYD